MPASRTRKAATRKSAPAAVTAATPMENEIRRDITAGVKRRLGLDDRERIPAEIQGLVDAAAREVAGNAISTAVVQSVSHLQPSPFSGSTAATAQQAASDVAVLHEAERLAAKRKALRVAGFSNDEAMRLLVAEVTGLAARG